MKKYINQFFIIFTYPLAVLHLRYLQARYRTLTLQCSYYPNDTEHLINKLILIQAKIEYYHEEFEYGGKFCTEELTSLGGIDEYENYMLHLFPAKDFQEIDAVTMFSRSKALNMKSDLLQLKNKPSHLSLKG